MGGRLRGPENNCSRSAGALSGLPTKSHSLSGDSDGASQVARIVEALKEGAVSTANLRQLGWLLLRRKEPHAADIVAKLLLPRLSPAAQGNSALNAAVDAKIAFNLPAIVRRVYEEGEAGGGQTARSNAAVGQIVVEAHVLIDIFTRMAPQDLAHALAALDENSTPAQRTATSKLLDPLWPKLRGDGRDDSALVFARYGFETEPDARHAHRLVQALLSSCRESEVAELLSNNQEALLGWTKTEPKLAAARDFIDDKAWIMRTASPPVSSSAQRARRASDSVLYVVHNSRPHASGGYSIRTHGVAQAIIAAGHELAVLARPGFPGGAEQQPDEEQLIDGVRYMFAATPIPSRWDYSYFRAAANRIAKIAAARDVTVIHAASNHAAALPAALAARKLGLPFVYEVRGFWDLTHSVAAPDYPDSVGGRRNLMLEALTSGLAGVLVTLTEPMRQRLIEDGAEPSSTFLLPNCADVSKFTPGPGGEMRRRHGVGDDEILIGYAGSTLSYEGLDDLIRAVAMLRTEGLPIKFMVVGDARPSSTNDREIAVDLREVARAANCQEAMIFTGRTPFDEVSAYYRAFDICPFPRKAFEVCELVSPLKPLEALAMEKAVIISSVGGMADQINHGETGLVFPKGDLAALAAAIRTLAADRPLRQRLGAAGRAWVLAERSWTSQAERLSTIYLQAGKASCNYTLINRAIERLQTL